MSTPMFDDFIELDLLDPSEASGDMFSYYLGSATDLDDSTTDLGAAAAALIASPDDESDAPVDLPIKQEDMADTNPHMLLDPSPLDQSSLKLNTDAHQSALVFGDQPMTMVSPDQLTITPQATTVSPATISLSAATDSPANITPELTMTMSTAAVSATTRTTSSSASKRSSPEPPTTSRKHAKTESVSSKSKSNASSRKSSTASTHSSAAAVTSATSTKAASPVKSTTSSSSSTTSILSSSTNSISSASPEPTAETLTSPVNTTLSPATLQFLLQQQEETPLIPQLFTGKLTREEIEATLARLLESTKHLITTPDEPAKVKDEPPASDDESDDNMDMVEGGDGAEQTHGLKTQPGIKTDDIPSSTDLKKMTSKERRQLRNKISARNFRVRRKEYIFTLEGQVLQHKTEARHLREAVTLVQDENMRLKSELEQVRRQLAEITIANSATVAGSVTATTAVNVEQAQVAGGTAPLSKENQTLLTSILNRNVPSALNPNAKSNLTLSMPRPQSPILTPNLHKDVPNSSSASTSQNSWKDKNPIMVHTTLVPEICFGDELQFGSKVHSKDDAMLDRPWMRLTDIQETRSVSIPFWMTGIVCELMQTFTTTMMAASPELDEVTTELVNSEMDLNEDVDWEVQQNMWALTQVEDEDEDEMTDEQIQLLYDISQLQISNSRSEPPSPTQEDPNMLEWLYESMMARLVDMDLQSSQESSVTPLSESNLA
ncbi:hypothetical protein EDD11_005349 [Mortierella claussenii]|nr:hypothetical protein EDD11_005349 [Mortierella claussenii]